MTINCIWFGDGALRVLDKFTIYSWRALGHTVNIYACKWNTSPHTTLGVKETRVNIIDLNQHIRADANPNLTKTKEVLVAWLDYAQKHPPTASGPQAFNIGDLSKSYIGGSQPGIVLDLKVGPSPHVTAYLPCFAGKFVSYTRGTNTPGGKPENQCMGTMGATADRVKYAKRIEEGVFPPGNKGQEILDAMKAQPTVTQFGKITHVHGEAAKKAGFVDTAKFGPNGGAPPKNNKQQSIYVVNEIGSELGHGPFRIFKLADDQTNREGGPKTTPQQQHALAQQVYTDEFLDKEGVDQTFVKKMGKLLDPVWS